MSGSFPGYQRRVQAQGGGGIVRAAPAADNTALARAMMGLSDTFNGIAQQERQEQDRRALLQAENDARTMAIRDENGQYVSLTGIDPATPAGRAMTLGVSKRIVDDVTLQGDAYFRQLRQGPQGQDPAAYAASVDAYVQETAQRVPDYARPEAEVALRRRGQEYVGGVGDRAWAAERERQAATSGLRYDMLVNDLLGLEEASLGAGPQAAEAEVRLQAHLGDMVRTQQITQEAADLKLEAIRDQRAGVRLGVSAEAIARTSGPEAARSWLNNRLNGTEGGEIGARALGIARQEGLRRIGVVEQERSFQQSELRGRFSTVAASVRAGVTSGPDQLERYAREADAAGMTAEAIRFRALGRVQQQLAISSGMALPQIMEAVQSARQGDLTDPASALMLSELQQLYTDRVNALKTDPVGFARSQPMVQEAVRRATAGQGSMQDVVAAQDAVLTANGVDPVGHRIVPQAEIAQLQNAIQNRPIVGDSTPENPGAADLIAAVFTRYGPQNAHRVWNDLRGAGLPETLRPVALLLTSPDQSNALRVYLEATRVGSDALRQGLGNDTAKDVREAVAAGLQALRATDSGTGQDARLMADAATAAQTLALVYAGEGSARDAAQRAVADVTAGLRIVDASLGRFRVPRGVDYDHPAFVAAMGRMLGREPQMAGTAGSRMGHRGTAGGFYDDAAPPATGDARPSEQPSAMAQVRFRIPPGAVSPGLTEEQAQEAYRRSLQSFGRFRTAPDGGGVWLQDDKGRPVFTEEGQPFGIRFGEERNPEGPAALRPSTPRGIRNNNPLNLEFRDQPGAAMESGSRPRFARFGSMDDGVTAATRQLLLYGQRGHDSVQAIVSRWAPPSENNTAAYIADVSSALGVRPGQTLNLRDPEVMGQLIGAMARKENGRPLDTETIRRGVARGLAS